MQIPVAAIKCTSYEEQLVQNGINQAVVLLGGWDKFVSPGDRVFLKLNLLMKKKPEEAVTTHPSVVKAVVQGIQQAGGQVTIGDSPGGPFTPVLLRAVYRATGMERVAEETGAALNYQTEVMRESFHQGRVVKSFTLCQAMRDCDKLISLSKVKTHGMTKYTGAVKVLFGCVPGLEKAEYHLRMPNLTDFSHMLIDLALVMKPTLNIMDAIVGMEGAGPSGGTPKEVGVVLASANPFALDVVAAAMIGMDGLSVPTIKGAQERDLPWSLEQVEVAGDAFTQGVKPLVHFDVPPIHHHVRFPFPKSVNRFLERYLRPKPVFAQDICVKCGDCVNLCPPKALTMGQDIPSLDVGNCIRCFCCQELCPKKAVHIKRPWLTKKLFK